MGTLVGIDAPHAGILDADLLLEQTNLLVQSIVFGLEPDPRAEAARGPTARGDGRLLGQCDHVEHRGADAAGPGLG